MLPAWDLSLRGSSHIQPKTSVKDSAGDLEVSNSSKSKWYRPNGLMCFRRRGDMAQGFVINLMPVGPQLANNLADVNHVPGDDGVVQNRKTTECMNLVAKFAAPQHAFFAKTQKPGEIVDASPLFSSRPILRRYSSSSSVFKM